LIIVFDRDFLPDVFFLNAQQLFYLQLYGQAVGIPTAFALYLKALESLVATKNIFDGACHHVVDARRAIGRGGAFKKYKLPLPFARAYGALKDFVFLPVAQYIAAQGGIMEIFIFGIFHNKKLKDFSEQTKLSVFIAGQQLWVSQR